MEKPKYLYKYKSFSTDFTDVDFDKTPFNDFAKRKDLNCARIIEMIEEEKIYVPTREELNDPLEGASLPRMTFAVAGSWYPIAKHRLHHIVEDYFDRYRILSLTKNPVSPQMWAHYAGNYSGICIQFSTEGTVFANAKPIEYYACKPAGELFEPEPEEIEAMVKKSLYKKSKTWEYEEEHRIITSKEEQFLKFYRKDIKSIILGEKIKPQYREVILEVAQKYNIPVYSTWYGDEDYKIYIIKIEALINDVAADGTDILEYAVDIEG